MNLNFALKDFYRSRKSHFPLFFNIILIVSFSVFFINFTYNTGLDSFFNINSSNNLFFAGSIQFVYSEFNSLILIMIIILAVVLISVSALSCILYKKRDIAIMRAIGTLPGNVHGFYLVEAVFIFIFGFLLGLFFGIISFGIYSFISLLLGVNVIFQIEMFYTLILFISCFCATIVVPGLILMKLGKKNIIRSFAKDIPHDYDASRKLILIPKILSRISLNLKMAVSNTFRRKGDFNRYLIVFSIIYSIIFTICLGTLVLSTSSQAWIHASQDENIVAIGHEDTLFYYSLMYEMFSNPNIIVEGDDINFTSTEYLFNLSSLEDINNISSVQKIDERLIHFNELEENLGYIISEYETVGQDRSGIYPIIGINSSHVIQQFVIDGEFFTDDGITAPVVVGDGLALNFFDSVFDQTMTFTGLDYRPKISGQVIDSFYNGFSVYMRLDLLQEKLNLTSEINLVLLKIESGSFNSIKIELGNIITNNLGDNFTFILLDGIFKSNLNYLFITSLYPLYLMIVLIIIGIIAIYNYQKGGIFEKAKDFFIMRALGSKKKSIERIIFLEGLFVILPSLILSLSIGMILDAFIIFDQVVLPPLYVPFIIIIILGVSAICFNYVSIIPLIKKIKQFSIKNFEIY